MVRRRSSLKQRVYAVLLTQRQAVSCLDPFGVTGRLLARLGLPEPWQGTIEASLRLIDELEREINECERELRPLGADHRAQARRLQTHGVGGRSIAAARLTRDGAPQSAPRSEARRPTRVRPRMLQRHAFLAILQAQPARGLRQRLEAKSHPVGRCDGRTR